MCSILVFGFVPCHFLIMFFLVSFSLPRPIFSVFFFVVDFSLSPFFALFPLFPSPFYPKVLPLLTGRVPERGKLDFFCMHLGYVFHSCDSKGYLFLCPFIRLVWVYLVFEDLCLRLLEIENVYCWFPIPSFLLALPSIFQKSLFPSRYLSRI